MKLNCAAIPPGLLESGQIFGHERGAFTGSVARKLGRFGTANHGTVFLDEIGDLPLELSRPKLLRILQGGEFERLGGNRHTTGRCADCGCYERRSTEDGLTKALPQRSLLPAERISRSGPSLRERADDIPELVLHFVAKYAKRMQRNIDMVPEEVMDALVAHSWPGNIRELQELIEHSVILTTGNVLCALRSSG